jgi:NADH-quinone oxidoreductase subunit H
VTAIEIGWGTTLAIKTVVVLGIVPLTALILGYVFLLKMMSHMQSRLGPMDPGGFHGWYQLIGDGIKFLQKEDIMPGEADRRVFALAPAIVVLSTFLVFVVIPAGPRVSVASLDSAPYAKGAFDGVGVFYALAVSSLSVIGVLMAGWASSNKYALLGALRAAAQLIAYELPLVLAVVGVVIQTGTMSLQGIVSFQQHGSLFGWSGVGFPLILTQFVGFALFMVAAQAELTQPPFDMPVAESELVAGYMVEYTGFRFLFFFIGEFGTAFAFAALAATLFLGGWSVPWVHGTAADFLGPVVLFAKVMFVAFLMFWARFTYPRFREDQLQAIAWKWLIPVALANILLTGVLKVAF